MSRHRGTRHQGMRRGLRGRRAAPSEDFGGGDAGVLHGGAEPVPLSGEAGEEVFRGALGCGRGFIWGSFGEFRARGG